MSLVIDEDQLEAAVNAVRREFKRNVVGDIVFDSDICVVAVVGAGMDGTPGVSGRVFSTLGREKINVINISQGSSQHNISFVVSSRDAINAVRALHREFYN